MPVAARRESGGLRRWIACVFWATLLCPWSALAEEPPALPERFMVRGGYLHVFGAETELQRNGPNGLGTAIDYSRTLGGERDYSGFRLDTAVRFNERHSLGLSYYRVLRDSDSSIARDISFRDITITAGANVTSSLNFDMWRLIYNYSFYRNEKVELGISPSLYMARMKFNIAGSLTCSSASSNCAGQPLTRSASSEEVTIPLPSLGAYVNYHITPRLTTQVRFDWFYLEFGDKFTGSLLEFYIGLEYRLFRHFAIGASYDRLQASVDLSKATSSSGLSIDNGWNTAFVYGAFYF